MSAHRRSSLPDPLRCNPVCFEDTPAYLCPQFSTPHLHSHAEPQLRSKTLSSAAVSEVPQIRWPLLTPTQSQFRSFDIRKTNGMNGVLHGKSTKHGAIQCDVADSKNSSPLQVQRTAEPATLILKRGDASTFTMRIRTNGEKFPNADTGAPTSLAPDNHHLGTTTMRECDNAKSWPWRKLVPGSHASTIDIVAPRKKTAASGQLTIGGPVSGSFKHVGHLGQSTTTLNKVSQRFDHSTGWTKVVPYASSASLTISHPSETVPSMRMQLQPSTAQSTTTKPHGKIDSMTDALTMHRQIQELLGQLKVFESNVMSEIRYLTEASKICATGRVKAVFQPTASAPSLGSLGPRQELTNLRCKLQEINVHIVQLRHAKVWLEQRIEYASDAMLQIGNVNHREHSKNRQDIDVHRAVQCAELFLAGLNN